MPPSVAEAFSPYGAVFEKYGKVLYGIFSPTDDVRATADATKAFLDLMFSERKQFPLKPAEADAERIRSGYFDHLLPDVPETYVAALLQSRRYAIIEGPPGTGKTRMALRLLRDHYGGHGTSIQFHPNTTYENFVGGVNTFSLRRASASDSLRHKGALMRAAEEALKHPAQPFLLHVDEINRADLAKNPSERPFSS